jgi:hypothetical protein
LEKEIMDYKELKKILNTECVDCKIKPAPNVKYKRNYCDKCFKKRMDSAIKCLDNLREMIHKEKNQNKKIELIQTFNAQAKNLFN